MAHIPYGYRIAGGKAEIDPEAKEKLDAFFASYLAGASIDKAAKEAGINRRHSVMAKMMQNPLYLGTDYYPRLISPGMRWLMKWLRAVYTINHEGRTWLSDR